MAIYDYVYYTPKEIDRIVKRAKRIARRCKYLQTFPEDWSFQFVNNKIWLDESLFQNKELFQTINYRFSYYLWLVYVCLYENYGDDVEELSIDVTYRYDFFEEEFFTQLNIVETKYLKKQLFYLDLVYWVLSDAKYKLTLPTIDNKYKIKVKDKEKKIQWYSLYYPVNLD